MYRNPKMELTLRLLGVIALLMVKFTRGTDGKGMFTSIDQWLENFNSNQKNYGVAVVDVDHDGQFEMIIAGYSGANIVAKYNNVTKKLENIATQEPYTALKDEKGKALGVCGCDIDGDGKEEIYVLNSGSYSGLASYGDKIFKWHEGTYIELYSKQEDYTDTPVAHNYAGRSVACVDRFGSGKYGFLLATYAEKGAGKFALIEMDEDHEKNDVEAGDIVLKNSAQEAKIDKSTGGRGIVVGPILQDDGKLDIFFDNEGNPFLGNDGANHLFKNLGDGTFEDVAEDVGVADENSNGRGIAVTDINNDGLLDIIYGNWMDKHRLFVQEIDGNGKRSFKDVASSEMAKPTSIRTVMVVDFDNDGNTEVLHNNINSYGPVPNKLFRVEANGEDGSLDIEQSDIGDAEERDGFGTGGAYYDFDNDGFLELMLSHGESVAQSLSLYKVSDNMRGQNRNWIRVFPITKYGAPARGATVTLTTKAGLKLLRVIDSGSGYLCQMEPLAHFGLDNDVGVKLRVQWPDGSILERSLESSDQRSVIEVEYSEASKPGKVRGEAVKVEL